MKNIGVQCGRVFYGRILPKGIAMPVLRGPLAGFRIIHGSLAGESGGASVYYGLVEPEQTAAICKILKPGDVFYDIGANVGYYTLLGAKLIGNTGTVVSVEPALRNICLLNRHLALNRLSNVQIVSAASADHGGLRRFVFGNNYAVGHLAFEEAVGQSAAIDPLTFIVPVVSIDSIYETTGLASKVVKIDVEGAEFEVLRGSVKVISSCRPTIILSTHSEKLKAQCKEFLAQYAYNLMPLNGAESNAFEWLCHPVTDR